MLEMTYIRIVGPLVIALAFFAVLVPAPALALDHRASNLVLTMDQGTVGVDVSSMGGGVAVLQGSLRSLGPFVRETEVVLKIESEWEYYSVPGPVIFPQSTGSTSIDFTLYVTVPHNVTAGLHILEVYGVTGEKESTNSDDVYLDVGQYADIGLEGEYVVEAVSGASYTMSLRALNLGNGRDGVSLSSSGEGGWRPDMESSKLSGMEPAQAREIGVEVEIPEQPEEGAYIMDVSARSSFDSNVTSTIYLRGYVRDGKVILAFGPRPILFITRLPKSLRSDNGIYGVEARVWSLLGSSQGAKLGLYQQGRMLGESPMPNISEGYYSEVGVDISHSSVRFKEGSYAAVEVRARAPGAFNAPRRTMILIDKEAAGKAGVSSISAPVAVAGTAGGSALAIGAAAYVSSERFKYALLALLIVPLYSRLKKDDMLNHFVRGRIYEYVRENPGAHFSDIKRTLDLGNGEATYHLRRLEKAEYLKSRFDGRLKRFYITGVKITKDMYGVEDGIKRRIISKVRENPGLSETALAKKIKVKRKERTIKHYIKKMSRRGELMLVTDGRYVRVYLPGGEEGDSEESPYKDEGRAHQDMI